MKTISILSGILLLLLSIFLAGMWTTHRNWRPYTSIMEARTVWQSFRATGMVLPENAYYKRAESAAEARYTATSPDKIAPGFLAVTRIDAQNKRYVTDLLNAEGEIVHTWPIDRSRILLYAGKTDFVHATTALPDGSILANFDNIGLSRFDVCGDPIWGVEDRVHHHSLYPDEAGQGYWTWQAKVWDGGHDQQMFRFDAETGEDLESIDLIDDVMMDRPDQRLAMGWPEGFRFDRDAGIGATKDLMHPNDVEPLPAAWAEAFPMFNAGDLLVSFRNINLVAVVDRQTHKIIWARYGPWIHQHDPDWHPDGSITVFSNNTERDRSSILKITMKTGEVTNLFDREDLEFYTFIMGHHQLLPNGNWLITSPQEGRIIEVTADGAPVREFNNYINETYNGLVTHAEVLPPDYFGTIPQCDQ